MNWRLFFKEIHFWKSTGLIFLISLILIPITFMIPRVEYAGLVFIFGAGVEYYKAIILLCLLAVKRITMNTFFWIDNLIALIIAVSNWFWFNTYFKNKTVPLIVYIIGWVVIAALVNLIFKRKRPYKSFDVKYGAAGWMKSWFEYYEDK